MSDMKCENCKTDLMIGDECRRVWKIGGSPHLRNVALCRVCNQLPGAAEGPIVAADQSPVADKINHVAHYNAGKIECIDAMEAAVVGQTAFEGVLTATAVKYLWRWKHKNGVEDVRKAIWYLNRLIAHLEKQ